MDGFAQDWYFSTMAGTAGVGGMTTVEFARSKYGRPLLVDAGNVASYVGFDRDGQPHVLDFHDILLVARGEGWFSLDGVSYRVAPGVVFFTRPGDLRQWRARGVDGACVFFREEFLIEVFSNPRLLAEFAFFRDTRASGALSLSPAQSAQYLEKFDAMRREIEALPSDASRALRATLYELLVLLDRFYRACYGSDTIAAAAPVLERFQASLERHFRSRHHVGDFAGELGITPGHLSALCRTGLRVTAGALIRRRIALEARRMLRYTDRPVAQIAYDLGFDDPAYFARFFRREVGSAPRVFRAVRRTSHD